MERQKKSSDKKSSKHKKIVNRRKNKRGKLPIKIGSFPFLTGYEFTLGPLTDHTAKHTAAGTKKEYGEKISGSILQPMIYS